MSTTTEHTLEVRAAIDTIARHTANRRFLDEIEWDRIRGDIESGGDQDPDQEAIDVAIHDLIEAPTSAEYRAAYDLLAAHVTREDQDR